MNGSFLAQAEPECVKHRGACWGLTIHMEAGERLSLEQIRAFLEASEAVGFEAANRKELYEWVNRAPPEQGSDRLRRPTRGLEHPFVPKTTHLIPAHGTP